MIFFFHLEFFGKKIDDFDWIFKIYLRRQFEFYTEKIKFFGMRMTVADPERKVGKKKTWKMAFLNPIFGPNLSPKKKEKVKSTI